MRGGTCYTFPMSQVFLAPARRDDPDDVLAAKISSLFDRAGLADCFAPGDLTALKLHVGEPGTRTFVQPRIARILVDLVKAAGARPFLTDTAVLYRSRRDHGPGHIGVALEHGFTPEAVGAHFLPADGLTGADAVEVPVNGKHYEAVSIANAIVQARSMLLLTHATGHLGTGLGGALKNLGMGCSSKKAKLRQHHGQHPRIDQDGCKACAVCAEWCPTESIEVGESARIDPGTCIGCGECVAVCLEGAVKFEWSKVGPELCERIVEHAAAVVRGKPDRIACVTVVMDVTKNCDCLGVDEEPVVADIGILAGRDPVALDRAVLDLVRERAGASLESLSYPDREPSVQIEYAEALGLGRSVYELVVVE